MPIPVHLKDVIEAIEPLADEWHACLNRDTGEIMSFSDEQSMELDADPSEVPEWLADELPKIREALSSDAYIELPGKFEFHEYMVMKRFALGFPQPRSSERMLEALQGRGAFGRFKDVVAAANIEAQWYAFRDEALRELAVEFLEENDIAFVDS